MGNNVNLSELARELQAGFQAGAEMRAANEAAENVKSQVVLGKVFYFKSSQA